MIYSATIPLTGTSFKTRGPFHKLDFCAAGGSHGMKLLPTEKKSHTMQNQKSRIVSVSCLLQKKDFSKKLIKKTIVKESGTVLKWLYKENMVATCGNWICACGVFVGNCSNILAPSHLIVYGIPKNIKITAIVFKTPKKSKKTIMWIKFVGRSRF